MSVPKNIYVGKRYVPKQCGDWNNGVEYESLSVVLWQGASYTSKQDVPRGVDIGNIKYWVKSADYNAQVAIYEQNVRDYHQYVIDQIGIINDSYDTFKEEVNQEFTTLSDNFKTGIKEFVNVLDYGAKLDGVTDDSHALELALADGNVALPPNSNIFIGSTIHINNSRRIIDGRESFVTVANGVTAFQIGTLDMSASILNVTIENMFVDLVQGGNFALSYNSYFITFSNIRIQRITNSAYGIKIHNGFNVTFREVNISGQASTPNESNISGNLATGIWLYLSTTGINSNVSGTANATNIILDNCLIQRVKYGVKYEATDGVFDTNKISNGGFSYCDYVIAQSGDSNGKFLNHLIETIRAEYCGTLFTVNGYITALDVYCYNTNYLVDVQNASAFIGFKGNIYHWNPAKTGCCVINSNLGTIDFSGATFFNYTGGTNKKSDSGAYGYIIPLKSTYRKRSNGATTLTLNPFYIEVIDQQTYIDFASITEFTNGSEFYMMSSVDNTNVLLPDGTYHRFGGSAKSMIHGMIVNGTIMIDGRTSPFASDTINQSGYGISLKDKIHFVTATASLSQFGFANVGIVILSSETNGVTLGNYTNSIINFADVLADTKTTVDLFHNVCILIPSGRGDGKGYIITNPKITHSV
jgi:hypothetical protein